MQDTLQPRWMHVIETKDRTLDDVMNYEIDGERLVDICTKFTVIERTF